MITGATQTQYRERLGLVRLLRSGLIKNWSVAIDGGAHVGTWSEWLRKRFETVHAFEPGPAYEHLKVNARNWPNVICHHKALADEPCAVESWHRKPLAKLTARKVRKCVEGNIEAIPLDSLELQRCDLLKLDVEGFEYPALIGAVDTIRRCRPFVLVELAGHGEHIGKTDDDVIKLIESMGYEHVWKHNVDHGFKLGRGR